MPVPTIYYLRHGETEWNALGRLQGPKDIPLNARGREQAMQAGSILADLFKRDGRDKAALPYVSSPLGRARQTMELARAKLELPVADYSLDARLREIGAEYGGESLFYYGGGGQGNHLGGAYAPSTMGAHGMRYRSSALAQQETIGFWVGDRIECRWVVS